MNLLSDIITYVRRIIKSPSNSVVSDNLIIDYINRFWIMDVDARMQLFDFKTKYQFQTVPGVDKYNMPLYSYQTEPGSQVITSYPVYQGFLGPAVINGVQCSFDTQRQNFYSYWNNFTQNLNIVAVGNGGNTYTFQLPILQNSVNPINPPVQGIVRGHIDISGIISLGNSPVVDPPVVDSITAQTTIPKVPVSSVDSAFFITTMDATGASVVIQDSGQFLTGNVNYGLLMQQGSYPNGNQSLGVYSTTSNTVNYLTGQVNVTFPVNIPVGQNINVQCQYFQTGLPRAVLFYNNVITLRSPPAIQYLVELDAYLTPAAFLSSGQAIQFGYMAEYIARGAARKMLADTGDTEQFMFYEPLFKEQEILVWKRSQRQFTSTRTQTIYSQGMNWGSNGIGNNWGGNTL